MVFVILAQEKSPFPAMPCLQCCLSIPYNSKVLSQEGRDGRSIQKSHLRKLSGHIQPQLHRTSTVLPIR